MATIFPRLIVNAMTDIGCPLAAATSEGLTAELTAAGGDPLLIRAAQESANHDAFLSASGMASSRCSSWCF